MAMEMAMISAARGNQAECMSALLAGGARWSAFIDIDTQECGGLTPLMVASAFGSIEVGCLAHTLDSTDTYAGLISLACGLTMWTHTKVSFAAYENPPAPAAAHTSRA